MSHNCISCSDSTFQKEFELTDHFLTHEQFSIHRCPSCGLRMTLPCPPPSEIGKYYETEDYLSHGADQKGLFAWLYRQAKKRNLSNKSRLLAGIAPQSHILDYGCGTGDFINHCQALGYSVRGAEPSPQATAHASSLVRDLIVSPEAELASERRYDIISLWHVLEHIHDPVDILTQLKAKLNNGGHIIIALPNPVSTDAQHYGPQWAGWDVPRHLWHYEPRSIIQLMEGLGMVHVDSQPMWFDAYYVSLLSERYKKGNPLSAIFWASMSNLKAAFDRKRKCSSQIYVFHSA